MVPVDTGIKNYLLSRLYHLFIRSLFEKYFVQDKLEREGFFYYPEEKCMMKIIREPTPGDPE